MNVKTKRKFILTAIAGVVLAFLEALFLEKYFFEIKIIDIGKKESIEKMKLLFLTDLHFKKYLDPSYKKLAKQINTINPDLILISGDVIDEDGIYAPAKQFFGLLTYAIPKVAIMGNHDHKNRIRLQTYQQLYRQNNGVLLINESKAFILNDKRLMVTGVDDFIEGNAFFAKAVKDVGKEENHVMLIHSPLQQEIILEEMKQINALRPEESKLNIQYIFAGHNHGGQVQFFGYAPIMPKKSGDYLKGWYNHQPPYLYLSRGFGTSTLPFRFGARSEVTVFNWGV